MSEIISPAELADVSSLFRPYVRTPIKIALGSRFYEMRLALEAERVRRVLRGFAQIAAELVSVGNEPRCLTVIGAGCGVEAIGAAHIFRGLRRLIITERHPALLDRAAANIAANIDPAIEIEAICGPLDALLTNPGHKADLLYANLLNVPFSDSPEVAIERRTNCRPVAGSADDDLLNHYQLAMPFRVLEAAPRLLNPDGSALLLIGGRVSYGVFDRLAEAAKVRFEDIVSGFKRQIDAQAVLAGHAAAETGDAQFIFYDFDAARRGLNSLDAGPLLEGALSPWRLSAREALLAFNAGTTIGHTYHLLRVAPVAGVWS